MKNKQLEQELSQWFDKIEINKSKNLWNKDSIAVILKKRLTKMGHFRRKPKGFLNF